MILVDIKDFTLKFSMPGLPDTTIIDEISFQIPKNKKMGLIGASGAGKTQIAHALMGLLDDNKSVSGHMIYDNLDLLHISENVHRHLRGNEISILFQDSATALNPNRRLGGQIIEALRGHDRISRKAAKRKAIELLVAVHMPDPEQVMEQYPHQLSGGMRQRVSMAIALAGSPRLIIADEPTSGLDVNTQAKIIDLLNEIHQKYEVSILLISHDLEIVEQFCEEVIVLFGGRIMEQGTPFEIFKHPSHPYTQLLLRNQPLKKYPKLNSVILPNGSAVVEQENYGCPFFIYCAVRKEVCREVVPRLTSYGRQRACLREIRELA